jgi:hypothetical protein
MSFITKLWKDFPDTSTPIDAAALEDMETRLSTYTDALRTRTVWLEDYCALDGVTDDAAGFAAAKAACGANGVIVAPANKTLKTNSQLVIDGAAAKIGLLAGPGFTIKAGAAIAGGLLLYKNVNDRPNLGVRGVILDMNSEATIGLEVVDCWKTRHEVRVINPAANTCVRVATATALGCYYNRIVAQLRGNDTAGSIGALVEGLDAAHKANVNVLEVHATDLGTGIKVGAFVGEMVLDNCDCTSNSIGYDITAGLTVGFGLHEEANTSKGVIVRDGAQADITFTYVEQREAAGTGWLRSRMGASENVTSSGATKTERQFFVAGAWNLREQWDSASGSVLWTGDEGIRDFFKMHLDGWFEMQEAAADPAAPAVNKVRVYPVDDGNGKTSLRARFNSGAVQQIAHEPRTALKSVASAAALTLPTDADVVQVTGTTNITSIAASWAERRVTLVFTGILTVTDGSNLKLGSNFVTSADDTISLVCDGTNWYEVSRSAN